jgi:N-acetylglucosaminyldiphosphoundecaprenol N-acetyl-beta-D-mannosaminyltransferase
MPDPPRPHTCDRPADGPRVGGVRIDALTWPTFFSRIESFIACGRGHVIHFLAADPTVLARGDRTYRDLLERGDLNLPDGMPVAWATRLFGRPATRLAGTDSLPRTAEWGVDRGLVHFFYGGTPAVADLLPGRLGELFPGIRTGGSESPPFRPLSDDELAADAARIRASGAQALWIGLGAPKQDVIGSALAGLDAAPVVLCVGAAFDFIAGTKPRAPEWMQRSGLEWAFRLKSEPRRLWRRYLVGNPKFVAGVAADFVRERARTRDAAR